ncbi:MAG: hypothetical protein Q7K35_03120 [bacterium]|nr:hypothetical protein [bacterium]
MITKKQLNLSPKKISSWLTVIIIFITSIVLIFVSIFLYKNFYQTITQSKKIIVLQGKVALYTVDIEKFNSIIDKITEKTQPKKINDIISPFR